MGEKNISELRRSRRKKKVVVSKKTLLYVIFQISISSIILLLPVFSQSFFAHKSTLIALCTLFFFGGSIVYLALRLLMMVSDWMGSGKHTKTTIASSLPGSGNEEKAVVGGSAPIKNPFWRDLEGVATILAWAFILKLLQPFFSALIWWQGYKLMEGRNFSLVEVERTTHLIENLVYLGIVIVLLLVSQTYWSTNRSKRSRSQFNAQDKDPISPTESSLTFEQRAVARRKTAFFASQGK